MDTLQLIQKYGYLALFIGVVLEGEVVLIVAGIAARQGYLNIAEVVAVAIMGGIIGDNLFFYTGKYGGKKILKKIKVDQKKIDKFYEKLTKYTKAMVIIVHFLYGFRIIAPVVIGGSKIKPAYFFFLDLLGVCLWATILATLGYFCGEAINLVWQNIKHNMALAIAVMLALGILAICVYRAVNKYRSKI